MGRIESRHGLSVEGRLRLLEDDMDKMEARLAKIFAITVTAAVGLITTTITLLLQGIVS